jgi:CRISPR-associated endonuclease/helicase Cas3
MFKSFDHIIHSVPKIQDILKDHNKYFAHTCDSKPKPKEKLQEHLDKVNDYCLLLIEKHRLDKVVDNLIFDFLNTLLDKEDEEKTLELAGNFIKTLFLASITFHDFGKINKNFQVEKMQNDIKPSSYSIIISIDKQLQHLA